MELAYLVSANDVAHILGGFECIGRLPTSAVVIKDGARMLFLYFLCVRIV